MRRNVIMIVLGVIMAFSLVACNNDTTDVESAEGVETGEDVLKIGMEAGYPPFNWTQQDDSNGAIPIEGSPEFANGYDVQIAKIVAENLGRDLVAVKTEWDGLVPALTSGKIEMIVAGMSPTQDRAAQIDFSEPYYESDFVLVVHEEGEYADATTLSDFSGANVVAQLNTSNDTVIDQIEGVNHLAPMTDFPTMRVAVQSGKADAYVAERPEAEAAQQAGVNLKMIELEDGFETDPAETSVAIGLVKGYENIEEIDEIIRGISEEERISIMEEMSRIQGE